jgi:hypothetical protein
MTSTNWEAPSCVNLQFSCYFPCPLQHIVLRNLNLCSQFLVTGKVLQLQPYKILTRTYLGSWVLNEKLPIVQPLNNFPAFYRTRKLIPCSQEPLLVPILNQIYLVHTIPSYLSKIYFNIVHPPTSWFSQWPLAFWLSHQYPVCIPSLPHSCYMPCPSHPPLLEHSNYVWRGVQVMKLFIMQFPPISRHMIPLWSKYSL